MQSSVFCNISVEYFNLHFLWSLKWLVQQNQELPERQVEGSESLDLLPYHAQIWQSLLSNFKTSYKIHFKEGSCYMYHHCHIRAPASSSFLLLCEGSSANRQWSFSVSVLEELSSYSSPGAAFFCRRYGGKAEGHSKDHKGKKEQQKLSLDFFLCQQQTHSRGQNQQ